MNTLNVSPERASLQLAMSDDRLGSEVGAIGRYRRTLINGDRLVDVGWICSKADYTYLAQAYRAFVASGGDSFLCLLSLDTADVTAMYVCRFVVGTFSLTSVAGETFNVKAQLSVTPIPYDADTLPFSAGGGASQRVLMRAAPGAYHLVGMAVILRPSTQRLTADTGVYVLTGRDNALRVQLVTQALDAGVYMLTGKAITLSRTRKLQADTGVYVLTGNNTA